MLPEMDGIDLMKNILEVADVPVIFLSVYGREEVVARAFDLGAVDYVVKPFSPTELAARIRAALRRRVIAEPFEPYVLGDLTIDYAERRVTVAGLPIQLTAMEHRMLVELSANGGRVLTHKHLLERVWGERVGDDVRPMRTIVSKLRSKLGDNAENPKYHLHRASSWLPDAQRRRLNVIERILARGDVSEPPCLSPIVRVLRRTLKAARRGPTLCHIGRYCHPVELLGRPRAGGG